MTIRNEIMMRRVGHRMVPMILATAMVMSLVGCYESQKDVENTETNHDESTDSDDVENTDSHGVNSTDFNDPGNTDSQEDPTELIPLSREAAETLAAGYEECERANSPCAEGMQCYDPPIGPRSVCLSSKEMACELFGCAGDCTIEEHSASNGDVQWTQYEVTTCLTRIPGQDEPPCSDTDRTVAYATACESPNVLVPGLACYPCLQKSEACAAMGCPTEQCTIATVDWDGEDIGGSYEQVYSCLEEDTK